MNNIYLEDFFVLNETQLPPTNVSMCKYTL